ncbi:MAG: hypothetical protein COU51_03115 [Parcubacteria group bacterium CG10_big_fil_rev_8_21_14_0_10_36_14]|nr:MAG: hypothetical protein COU51_03115 [Parcubacteria group bacterium CG10_big_fil_rev_8_21_14_0_10_36_14]
MLNKISKIKYINSPLIKFRKVFLIIFLLAISIGIIFLFKDTLFVLFNKIPTVPDFTKEISLSNVQKIITSEPLIKKEDASESQLTAIGVFYWTNYYREKNGKAPLKQSVILNASATLKAKDMFAQQYFEHTSPTGEDAGYWVNKEGYEFIIIGENLALGNFQNDEALVNGWMASPGHKANILNPSYTEIGIAVIKATYQGKETWMAVQHFGRPLSDCSMPDETLKNRVIGYDAELNNLKNQLLELQKILKSKNKMTKEEYNKKVDQYNAILLEYNSIYDAVKVLADTYNEQVQQFNNCIK